MFSHSHSQASSSCTLGSILIKAGLITQDVLDVALEVSKGLNVKLGQVLTDTKRISGLDLENALTAQCLMVTGYYDPGVINEALRASHRNNTAFAQVLHFS